MVSLDRTAEMLREPAEDKQQPSRCLANNCQIAANAATAELIY